MFQTVALAFLCQTIGLHWSLVGKHASENQMTIMISLICAAKKIFRVSCGILVAVSVCQYEYINVLAPGVIIASVVTVATTMGSRVLKASLTTANASAV